GDCCLAPWETARRADELLACVRLAPWPSRAAAYVKFGVYERPTLGVAVALGLKGGDDREGAHIQDARVAVGCVGPRPARVPAAEARLRGVSVDQIDDVIGAVGDATAAGVDPADDLHGSADYKREMVAVFLRRALRAAPARASGRERAQASVY